MLVKKWWSLLCHHMLLQGISYRISVGVVFTNAPPHCPNWVSWIILIIKGTESASSLEMKPRVIFKSGALNFWWTVTETGITTIQKSHPLTDRDQHLWMISSNPLPSNFFPAPLIKTHLFASCFQFSAIMPLTGHCLAGHHLSNTWMQGMGVWNRKSYNEKRCACPISHPILNSSKTSQHAEAKPATL